MRTYYYKISKSVVKAIYELKYDDGLVIHYIYLTNGRLADNLLCKIQNHCDIMNDIISSSSSSNLLLSVSMNVIYPDNLLFAHYLSEIRNN